MWVLAGLAGLAWIGVEDRSLGPVIGLSWLICAAGLQSARLPAETATSGSRIRGLPGWALAGAIAGALVGPVGAVLALVKVGLHAHPVADFTAQDLGSLLRTAPIWAVAGGLLGAGLGMIERSGSR